MAKGDLVAPYLNIILPVYNEEDRLLRGVEGTMRHFDETGFQSYQLTIVDNASVDGTEAIARQLASEHAVVRYIRLERKGVGVAFQAGIAANESPVVGYMDIDLSTDVRHLDEVIVLFEADPDLGMVNGSRLAADSVTTGRKWYRNVTSHGLTFVLKAAVGLKATDSICGFKFFRRDVVERLIEETLVSGGADDGWFFIIELLLRAERDGVKICELPVRWADDPGTKVDVVSQVVEYLRQIRCLRRRL